MPPVSPSSPEPLVFDAHVDALQRQLDLGHDLGLEGPGHFDLVRARRGGLAAVVLVCWVDPQYIPPERGGAFQRTELLLREAHRLARKHPQLVRLCGNGNELAQARAAGCIAGIPGIEGGHSIEESLDKLEWFFERGVRVLTLVWNNHLSWVRSCQAGAGADVPEGLSSFGREVVRCMNRLGMLVDLSHAGERSFYDALECGEAPAIASHSGCRALHEHPRNLTDEQLRALAQAGGVIGIVFHPGFLDANARGEEARVRASAEWAALGKGEDTATFLAQSDLMRRAAPPLPLARLVEHVLHAIEVAGVEHVGLGSDFDGILRSVEGVEDAAGYGALARALRARGLSEAELRLVLGGNMERVFARATGPGTRAHAGLVAPALA